MDSRLLCGWIKRMKMLKSLHVENVSGVYTKEEEIIDLKHLKSLTIIYNTNKPRTGFRFYNFTYPIHEISIYMDLDDQSFKDFEWDHITHAFVKLLVFLNLRSSIPVGTLCDYSRKFRSLRRLRIDKPLYDPFNSHYIDECAKRNIKLELSNSS